MRPVCLFACLCFCLFSLSCGEKERSNPLDPSNSLTHGSPPGFRAIAMDDKVLLRWEPLQLERLEGLNLYRREAGTRGFGLVQGSPFPGEAGEAEDTVVTNGVTYEYRLVPLITGYGEGVPSPVLAATPGSDFAIVSDGCKGLVTMLSADMRSSVWAAGGFYYPICVATTGARVWLADPYTGVYCITQDGALLWNNSDSMFPIFLAVRHDGLCAVVDATAAVLRVLSSEGRTLFTISEGLRRPACVAFDLAGNIWLTDRTAGSVTKYTSGGTPLASFTGLVEPRFLDSDAVEQACWVGDVSSGDLVKLDSQADEILRVPFSKTMSAVKADRTGGCWVADAARDVVARVGPDGKVLFVVGKLGGPVALFPSGSGKVWVVGSTEPRVSVLSSTGELISAAGFGECPTSVVVVSR